MGVLVFELVRGFTSSVLSSWRTRPVCESAFGMVIIEYDSPVWLKALSSTAVRRTPRAAHEKVWELSGSGGFV